MVVVGARSDMSSLGLDRARVTRVDSFCLVLDFWATRAVSRALLKVYKDGSKPVDERQCIQTPCCFFRISMKQSRG